MSTDTTTQLDQQAINTIRTLAMDAVEKANSGHPGTPMALAPVAYALWRNVLRYDPDDPLWPGRDRFVLSCGHASMLLYALIHLAGIKHVGPDGRPTGEPELALDQLRNFRQWNSRTPGHPEFGHTCGVETTTGPLGQGCGNSVGMALAARWLAERYNRPELPLFDYNVYALAGDGDFMEGVTSEAASLAGHLRLANLCWIYDDNRITIEGNTELAFSEDVATRFQGLGWQVLKVDDANDLAAIERALGVAAASDSGPTLIVVRSHIAYGAPNKQDTHAAHGAPLGAEEIRLAKRQYGWPEEETFLVPEEAAAHFRAGMAARGRAARDAWQQRLAAYRQAYPDEARQLDQIWSRTLPEAWDADIPVFPADAKGVASRSSSAKVLNAVARKVPWLVGGAADLAPSTKTTITDADAGDFLPYQHGGRNVHFGIREHAMAAAVNGMTLSGLRGFGATFFVFCDYLRPAMRLSALMQQPALYIFTHDSIGVGEDGPTHQPIEQLAAVRSIPRIVLLRPADANEVAEAWRTLMAINDRPVALVLTRQNLPTLDRTVHAPASGLAQGAYILKDADQEPLDVILIGTGSEVELCLEARQQLAGRGLNTRVVSMPSWELFEDQEPAYREHVLPPTVPVRVAVEAGVRQGWDRYIGTGGRFVGVNRFGASAAYQQIYREFGLTADRIVEEALAARAGQ